MSHFDQKRFFQRSICPLSPISYGSREGAQEAHEAIRPSDVTLRSGLLSGMEPDAERLYDLIWRQFCGLSNDPRPLPLDHFGGHPPQTAASLPRAE